MNEIKIKPMGSRILIKPRREEEIKTTSGLILKKEHIEDVKTVIIGDVVEVGNKVLDVKIADVVMYNIFSGTPYLEYLLLEEEYVLCIVPEWKNASYSDGIWIFGGKKSWK